MKRPSSSRWRAHERISSENTCWHSLRLCDWAEVTVCGSGDLKDIQWQSAEQSRVESRHRLLCLKTRYRTHSTCNGNYYKIPARTSVTSLCLLSRSTANSRTLRVVSDGNGDLFGPVKGSSACQRPPVIIAIHGGCMCPQELINKFVPLLVVLPPSQPRSGARI